MRNGDSYEFGGGSTPFYVEPGDYTVTVDGSGANVGAFAFRLLDLGTAEPLAKETVVERRISGSAEMHAYKLSVDPGERLFIDIKSLSSGADRTTIRLIDPYGRQVIGPVNLSDLDTGVLAIGGTYTLLVEGRVWREWPTDYRMAVYSVGATGRDPDHARRPQPRRAARRAGQERQRADAARGRLRRGPRTARRSRRRATSLTKAGTGSTGSPIPGPCSPPAATRTSARRCLTSSP